MVPSFNHAPYIEATLRSVLEQDHHPIELIVMDGGSTDGTCDILRRFEGQITWESGPDAGQADAIARGLARSRGQILSWLNSDDTLAPGAVSAVVKALQQHPGKAVVYGDATFIDARGGHIAPCAHVEPFCARRLRHYSDFIVQPAAFFRREAYEAVGGIDPSLHYAMDYDLWLKLASAHGFVYLPKVLAHYRWLGTNKSAEGGEARLREVDEVVRRHGIDGLPAYFRLEAFLLKAQQALAAARSGHLLRSGGCMLKGVGGVISSRRAMRALFERRTWRVIYTGQLLRKRSESRSAHS